MEGSQQGAMDSSSQEMQPKEVDEGTAAVEKATPPVKSTDEAAKDVMITSVETEVNSGEPSESNTVVEKTKDDNGFVYYKCRFCGLTFNYTTTLRAHERVHNIDQPYKCNKCSESFHFMCELEYHAKQHGDMKGFKCECGRTFHTFTDLLYHKHPGEDGDERVVVSSEAERSAAVSGARRIPDSEFPTPEFMEKGFEPKHPLKVYSDIRLKPYICQYCSKSYADSRQLTYHMYSHRGERIFNPRASRYLMGRDDNSYISPGM